MCIIDSLLDSDERAAFVKQALEKGDVEGIEVKIRRKMVEFGQF